MERYDFGSRVAQLRKVKGMTQAQLAEILGVSNKTISRWETGDGYPDISLLKPLANALGVSVDYLLDNEMDDSSEATEVNSAGPDTGCFGDAGVEIDGAGATRGAMEKPFNWRRPRWNDLTTLNKIATVTLLIVIGYNVVWWILASFTATGMMNIAVVINALIIKSVPWIGIGCAVVGLIRGEMGTYYRQRNVSIALILLNLILPIVLLLISVMFPIVYQ